MSATPHTDALLSQWDDDGASRGPAFCALRDHARELERELAVAREVNIALARWKGEIDSRLIAARVEFPEDYDNSPKWAVEKLREVTRCGS